MRRQVQETATFTPFTPFCCSFRLQQLQQLQLLGPKLTFLPVKMAFYFYLTCVMLFVSRMESCLVPDSVYVVVPPTLPAGYEITQVRGSGCNPDSLRFWVRDAGFRVSRTGLVATRDPVSVAEERTFSVWTQDDGGIQTEMEVHLVTSRMQSKYTPQYGGKGYLKRTKRRWGVPPFNILENQPGPFPKEIEKVASDSEVKRNVYYTISGPGFDQDPVGVFSIDSKTGVLFVHKPVDREANPSFTLTCRVFDVRTHVETDAPLGIQIDVDDVNDNAPEFVNPLQFSVAEQSPTGTVVGRVNATDRDKEGSLHVKIKFSLLTGLDLFHIHPETGVITTGAGTLDREVEAQHAVVVKIQDLDGAVTGLYRTGTATISLMDINDNPPTFLQKSYEATVKENESGKLILRIPVEDKDLVNSPNWISQFIINKGNENGNFRIQRDPDTNDGLLYMAKPLDYEKNKKVHVEVTARNEADLIGTTAGWNSASVDLTVSDVDEGPEFTAPTVWFTVKENTPNDTLIGRYTAVDPETQSSDGIKYYKVLDPGSWINVDRNSGELRVANVIDRESPLVHDGIYNVTMKAVDASSKTGTGTVIIQVEDANDNVPVVPPQLLLCEQEGELGSVLVVAEDMDQSPYSSPFLFSLAKGQEEQWSVKRFNDTAATLQQTKVLHKGTHEVDLEVRDLQGLWKLQTVKVQICQCRNEACLVEPRSIWLGGLAVLAMLLPLLLLLLLCLLLAIFCVTKREQLVSEDIGDSGGILLKSNTEAPGEEVDSSVMTALAGGVDSGGVKGSVKGSMINVGWVGNKSSSAMGQDNGTLKTGVLQDQYYSSQYTGHQYNEGLMTSGGGVGGGMMMMGFDNKHLVHDASLLHTWQTNGCYLHQKLAYLGSEEDGRYADDILHSYGFEGVGSAAGSVGCCSDVGDADNLDFLNSLGPKFKTLAGVCTKT